VVSGSAPPSFFQIGRPEPGALPVHLTGHSGTERNPDLPEAPSRLNSILQVVDPEQLAGAIQRDADQVNPSLGLLQTVFLKVILGRGDKAPGLCGGDGFFTSA